MKPLSPIALFTYNRLVHTRHTIEALANNKLASESRLYIFSDGAKDGEGARQVEELHEYLKNISGFKAVHLFLSNRNNGLATSIIKGVSQVFEHHDSVIVLEDDLQTSPYFLTYMNDALNHYSPDQVWSVAGYSPKIEIPSVYNSNTYLARRNCSWGWATWKQNWEKTDWGVKDFMLFFTDKKERRQFERGGNDLSVMLLKQQQQLISSWSIRFNYAAFKNDLPTVYPLMSMVKNIGVDGSGTNMKRSGKYETDVCKERLAVGDFCGSRDFNEKIERNFKHFYNTSLYRKAINYFKVCKAKMQM